MKVSIFTPDDEPYLGRGSVFQFDQMIQSAMEINAAVGPWTRVRNLSPLQRAATELIPHGFSIALSIRELVRQGYLISAEILLRPLVERVAVISYLCETPSALDLWEAGWPHKTRPPLYRLLAAMRASGETQENEEIAREITQRFNALIHADPMGARRQASKSRDGRFGYTASKSLDDAGRCDDICFQCVSYLVILMARTVEIFPDAVEKRDESMGDWQ